MGLALARFYNSKGFFSQLQIMASDQSGVDPVLLQTDQNQQGFLIVCRQHPHSLFPTFIQSVGAVSRESWQGRCWSKSIYIGCPAESHMQKPSCSVRYLYTQQTVLKDTLFHFLGYLILFIRSSPKKLKKQKGRESIV